MERKNRRLSSETLKAEADERKRKSSADPGGEIRKGSTCGTAVGAKQGRTKGNKQKAEYLESDGRHGKPGWKEEEEQGSESGTEKLRKPTVRRRRRKRGKEEAES